jgi:hypothetical protein
MDCPELSSTALYRDPGKSNRGKILADLAIIEERRNELGRLLREYLKEKAKKQ